MAEKALKDLTLLEIIALAYTKFRLDQFTSNNLASYLCAAYSTKFKVPFITWVDSVLLMAVDEGIVVATRPAKGQPRFNLTEHGVDSIEGIDLPLDLIERREQLDAVKHIHAERNAGPVLVKVYQMLMDQSTDWDARSFLDSVSTQWLGKKWLSAAQAETLVKIAGQRGEFLDIKGIVGKARDEWLEPYLERNRQRKAEEQRLKIERHLEFERQRKEKKRIAAERKGANDKVKAELKEMDAAGKLADVDKLVSIIYPEMIVSKVTKSNVYGGSGSAGYRVCLSALVFGKPPSEVWQQVGQIKQPNAASEHWQTVLDHPMFQTLFQERKTQSQS